jgi:FG-GAP-like repeat
MKTYKHELMGCMFFAGSLSACAVAPADSAGANDAVVADDQKEPLTATTSHVVDSRPNKPAFIHVADLDTDGSPEIIVSAFGGSGPFGSGNVAIYKRRNLSDLSSWTKQILPGSNGTKFPNKVSTLDVDGDGDLDIVVPSGFLACIPFNCGALAWYERTTSGWTKHTLVTGKSRFYHHVNFVDLDGDGLKDFVTVAEQKGVSGDGSAEVQLFRGARTADRFVKTPVKLADGLGSIPTVFDIDNDGDLDIASAEYFGSRGSFAWLENTGSLTRWNKHYIDTTSGKSIELSFVENLIGDGRLFAVGSNHTNTMDDRTAVESAVFMFSMPSDPRQPWTKTQISTGIVSVRSPAVGLQGAPGVFDHGDPDGDGDIDVVVHGDGDPRVFVLEQTAPGVFSTNLLAGEFNQGGVAVADLDGDGIDEIVASSYEKNKLQIFKYNRR